MPDSLGRVLLGVCLSAPGPLPRLKLLSLPTWG